MAKNRYNLYSYDERRYSGRGLAALLIGLASSVVLAVLAMAGILTDGQVAPVGGAVGLSAFLFTILGVNLGLKSFREPCRSYLVSKIGTVYCGLMTAAWFLLYCIGAAV